MPRRKIPTILAQSRAAWTDKDKWRALLRDAYEFALPQRNPYYSGDGTGREGNSSGARKSDRVFDSTLQVGAIRLANRIQNDLVPAGKVWGGLKPGPLVKPDIQEQAAAQLAPIGRTLFTALGLAGFDSAIGEWLLDLVIAGTAVMQVMKGTGEAVLEFTCLPQSQVAFREGPNGKIWEMYRRHKIRLDLILETWDDAKLPQWIKDKLAVTAEGSDPGGEEVNIVEAVCFNSKDNTWYYDVILDGGSGSERDKTAALVEREYADGVWVAARWVKAVGETHGRSQVMMALADAKTLSKLKELLLANASMAVKGAWLVKNDGMVNANTVRIVPGARIAVRSTGGTTGASVARLDVGGDLHLAQIIVEDLVSAINAIMLNKSLPPDGAGVRSATEIVERIKEIQVDVGSPIGRVVNEGIVPMLQIALGVLGKAGIVPMNGNRAIPIDGARVRLEITSPLAASANLDEVDRAVQWAQIQLSTIGKEAFMLTCKVEDFGSWLADKMMVDRAIVRPAIDRAKIQQIIGSMLAGAAGGGQPAPGAVGPGAMVAPAANDQAAPEQALAA